MYSLPAHKHQLSQLEREVDAEIGQNPLGSEHVAFSQKQRLKGGVMLSRKLLAHASKCGSDRRKKNALSALSKSRTLGWVDNLSNAEADEIANGAVREANTQKRQPFEGGNWKGQKITKEGRYYDKLYVRQYEPDAVRQIKQ